MQLNTAKVNEARLNLFSRLVKKTMGMVINTAEEGVFSKPADADSFEEHDRILDTVITDKLRKKFNI